MCKWVHVRTHVYTTAAKQRPLFFHPLNRWSCTHLLLSDSLSLFAPLYLNYCSSICFFSMLKPVARPICFFIISLHNCCYFLRFCFLHIYTHIHKNLSFRYDLRLHTNTYTALWYNHFVYSLFLLVRTGGVPVKLRDTERVSRWYALWLIG